MENLLEEIKLGMGNICFGSLNLPAFMVEKCHLANCRSTIVSEFLNRNGESAGWIYVSVVGCLVWLAGIDLLRGWLVMCVNCGC